METLTKRQEDILTSIKKAIASNGYPPTVREIGAELNLSSPATIHTHLTNLEKKGYLKRNGYKNRAIELLVNNEFIAKDENTVSVPLLGMITAGNPIEAIEMPDEYINLPSYLVPKKKEVFSLSVSGESMINVGVLDGDTVIVQRQSNANNGDMVVAMNKENEVTLKTFYKESDHFRLQPENDTMEPIIVKEVTILGKAIGLYRQI